MINKETAEKYCREIARQLSPELCNKLCDLIDHIQVVTFIETKTGKLTDESMKEKIKEYFEV